MCVCVRLCVCVHDDAHAMQREGREKWGSTERVCISCCSSFDYVYATLWDLLMVLMYKRMYLCLCA